MKVYIQILLLFFIVGTCHGQKRATLYNPKDVNNWAARHNMTPGNYQNEVTRLHKKGFRLIHVDGYNVNGKVKFAALWKKGKTSGLKIRHGLSNSAYQKEVEKNHKNGYRLIHVDGYNDGGNDYYAAIWSKQSTSGLRAKHGLTGEQYQNEVTKNHKDGYRLASISGYGVGGTVYYAAIWNRGDISKLRARHGLSRSQYQDAVNKNWDDGYYVTHVDSYNASGKVYYAAIFEKKSGRYSARHNMNSKNYELQIENHHYQGFMPISVSGHDAGNSSGYAAAFKSVGGWKGSDTRQFSSRIRKVMDEYNIPGASIAIVKDGRLVYAKGWGWGNRGDREIASATSLYRIASVSKPITGVAIMKLTEDTDLSLGQYVFGPGAVLGTTYGSNNYGTREKQIRVRHLLEHRAGGNSWDNDFSSDPDSGPDDNWSPPMFAKRDLSRSQLIGWVLDNRNPSEKVNSVFAYSNFGYCVLGRIIEKKSGMSYEKYVKNKILKPSGISNMHIGSSKKSGRKYKEVVYYGDNDT
ncbi:MAG: serine hydrolase, partial [Flavobacteriaceae bacterium]|nr:serine hydrolase [Flavobacteriaceae bacterium]